MTSFIIKNYSHIGIEDLNVSGMVKNHNLARAISGIEFYEFKRQLEYKSKMNGNHLFIVDRFFLSSKKYSVCDEVKKDLKLSDRFFRLN